MMVAMSEAARNPAYRVLTERLLLRCWSPADAPQLRAALDASDNYLRPWIPFMREEPRTVDETAQWLRGHRAMFDRDENYRYGVFTRDGSTVLGETMLLDRVGPDAREIGYWMDVRQSGHGYATEAAGAMVHVAFEIDGVDHLEIHCSPDNAPSIAVAKKLGFHHEATLKARFRDCNDDLHDTMVWTLFAADARGQRAAIECFDAAGRPLS